MKTRPTPAVDINMPSAARVYDYWLGGAHNFEVDRDLAAKVEKDAPTAPLFAVLNRRFVSRAVKHMVSLGITQFLDLGSGLPTAGNVHEIAQWFDPTCRVVYVDKDPISTSFADLFLRNAQLPNVGFVLGWLQDVDAILSSDDVQRLIDRSQPLGLIMTAVLHFVPNSDDPAGIIAQYRDALAGGSRFAFSHVLADIHGTTKAARHYKASQDPAHLRSYAEIEELAHVFGPLDEPGLVYTPSWCPENPMDGDKDPSVGLALGAVAAKCTAAAT
ncbi:SAM-dependent methyltransferase [Kutzneria sp. 744]|uniref:SAM-dependent methyltransferase n=1 Tax=Kutzneria sp. (strain 744) TaxID=345341 RepID=UPI0003EEDE2F|nr:SAM-dependent methyltransferase [Kutzneria sp. 744]EWM19840.1 hypothetical protein KUTG_10144 [Kutzneria sp. 744]